MVEFGDEFVIESYRIPWLIWIQLLVMILLIVLLFFGFAVFTTDASASFSAAAAASPSSGGSAAPQTHHNISTFSNRIIAVEDQRASRDAATSGESIREDDHGSGEESSVKDSMFLSVFRRPNHPCNYIGLAKQALFKCFGFDSSSENSGSHQHEKRE